MTKAIRPVVLALSAAILCSIEPAAQPVPEKGAPTKSAQRPAPTGPPAGSASIRPTGSSLGTIRLGAADERIWFGWRVGIPSNAIRTMTFSEAAAKADALGLGSIEGFSTQMVSREVPKNLDYNLAPGERAAVSYRLRELGVQMTAYHVDSLGADESTRRKVFELAKGWGVQTIVTESGASLADLDKLATEFGINVAVVNRKDPRSAIAGMEGLTKRMGVSADLGAWALAEVKPIEGLNVVKDRLFAITVGDMNAPGMSAFFLSAYQLKIKPLFIAIQPSANLTFEKVMLPAMTARVADMVNSPPGQIRGGDRLSPEMRQQIDAAAPRQALVKPKKARKLLVTDIQMYSGHETIPHGNLMLELMAKYTGAFEPTFSNDLNNLKYPKIKEYDAVFLNNVCGMVFNDPEVRAGLLRFVREGGGLGGNHAVTYANLNWPEFTQMLGGWSGAHHTEKQVLKIDDPSSPLMAMFGSKSFEHSDEFYQFPASSPYSREKQRVLMSIDVEKSDRATNGRFCPECTRPDQDYGMMWIKSYGKGRVYCTPLGHTTIMYTQPQWTQHMLAAVQFILGDLDANTTPSVVRRVAAKK